MINIFLEGERGIIFDTFKKIFFPHFYLVPTDKDDADEIRAHKIR